jgi:hypothetical protein
VTEQGLRLMKREPNLCSIFLALSQKTNRFCVTTANRSVFCLYCCDSSGPSPPPLHASARRQAAKEDGGEGQCDNKLQHDENEGC